MAGALLIVDLMAISLAVYVTNGRREFLREAVLTGFVLWGVCLLLATEALSLFYALGFWQILIFWAMILALCVAVINKYKSKTSFKEIFHPRRGGDDGNPAVRHWPFLEKVFFNRIVFFSSCLGIIALVAPPSTYDAMTYHLGRVMHWIQDHSVGYYPTHIPRQLYDPVFSEYVILHFQLLSGGDYWANFVQWLAMCGSLIAVSLIAKELGAGKRGQILSALTAVTVPMGVLQATSTQTDYVETLWTCIFIYFSLRWQKNAGWRNVLSAGAALGLAISTKGIAVVLAGPFLLWLLLEGARRMDKRKILMLGAMMGLAALFYAGSFYRNFIFFHGNAAKVVSADADSLINARFCWEGFAANVLRNTALNVVTPSMEVNKAIERDIYKFASFLHIDLNRRDWTYIGIPYSADDIRGNENYLGNPLHLLLFGIVLVFFLSSSKLWDREAVFYLAACVLGWIAFNLILKWQPWHTRFHLPMFVIFAPIAGLVLERIKIRWVVSGLAGALFLLAWAYIFLNVSKPIISTVSIFYPQDRDFLHFMLTGSPQSIYLEYKGIANSLHQRGCKNIGLIMGPDENEYLWWVVLNPSADPKIRIESILVNNTSASLRYPLGDFLPDAIIAINDDRSSVIWENNIYQVVWHSEDNRAKKVSILMKIF